MHSRWHIVAVLTVSFVVAASLLLPGQARAQIDISGEWSLDIFGDLPMTCSATISQVDSDFDMELDCPSVGVSSLSGTIDLETGDFGANGTLLGIPLGLVGIASADGSSISGYWSAPWLGFGGTFTGTHTGAVETPTPLPTFSSPVDISGTWEMQIGGLFGGSCVSVIIQEGTELTGVAECVVVFPLSFNLSGTIDPNVGTFSFDGDGILVDGVATADGNSFSGTWNAFGLVAGLVTGSRSDDIELVDVSGDFTLVFDGDLNATCLAVLQHSFLDLTASLDCGDMGAGEWVGSANPLTGSFALAGVFGDLEVAIVGSLVAPGLSGGWFGRASPESGAFIGVSSDQAHLGIVAVDCNIGRSGLQQRCGSSPGSDASVQVVVMLPPADGYSGFQIDLVAAGPLLYEPADDLADEALWPDCVDPLRQTSDSEAGTSILFRCPPPGAASPGMTTGPLVEFAMACAAGFESSETFLSLRAGDEGTDTGTLFSGPDGARVSPVLFEATVSCVGPQFCCGGPAVGDANCDFRVNSIDAALVLQQEAGLIDSLPCQQLADADRDGDTTSLDATLILQHDAGLISL